MSRFLCAASALLLSATLLMGAQAQTADTAPVARGLIVQLKTAPEGRESAQAQRERLTGIAADAGLASSEAPMAVGANAHLLRFARPLQPQAMPQLLDAQFPQRLRELLQATPSEPARANARSHAPQTGARSYATPPRELQPWLALLIALLFALERLLATQVRRGAPA